MPEAELTALQDLHPGLDAQAMTNTSRTPFRTPSTGSGT